MEINSTYINIVHPSLLKRGDIILYGNQPAYVLEINPIGKKCFAEILINGTDSIFIERFNFFYVLPDEMIKSEVLSNVRNKNIV